MAALRHAAVCFFALLRFCRAGLIFISELHTLNFHAQHDLSKFRVHKFLNRKINILYHNT